MASEEYQAYSYQNGFSIPEVIIRQAFYKKANAQGFIHPEDFEEILDEIKLGLPNTSQKLKILLTIVDSHLLDDYNGVITYKEFQQMLEDLLKGPETGEYRHMQIERANNSVPRSNAHFQNRKTSENDPFTMSVMPWPKYYRSNKEKLDNLLKNHRDELYIKFKERETPQGSGRIILQDYYTFMQECLYIGSIVLLEHAEDTLDFFQLENSYNKFCKVVESYFLKNQERGHDVLVLKSVTLTFLQCFDILDNWFKSDHNVVIFDDADQGSTMEGILGAISKYEKILFNSQNYISHIEKQALKKTLQELYERLENLKRNVSHRGSNELQDNLYRNNAMREEKRIRALKEIFDFFCRKGLKTAKSITFEEMSKQARGMSLEKFSIMIKDLRIKIDQFKLVELFNKVKHGVELLSFYDFEYLLKKIAQEVEFVTEVKEYKFDRSVMKNYKPDTYKHSPMPKKEKAEGSSQKRDNQISYHEQEKIEALWNYMGLYDDSYKKVLERIRGNLSVIPTERSERADSEEADEIIVYKHKTQDGIEDQERRKNAIKNLKGVRSRKSITGRDLIPSMVQRSERYSANIKGKGQHLCLKPEELCGDVVTRSLTLHQAENLDDKDIKKMDKNFHPMSLISQNDEDDEMYLAEYDLSRPSKKKEGSVTEKAAVKTKLPLLYKVPPSLRRYSQIYNYRTHKKDQNQKEGSANQIDPTAEETKNNEKETEILKNAEGQDADQEQESVRKPERKSVPVTSKQRSISSDVYERANQVQEYLKNKQLKMIDNILNIQAIMHQKGFKTAWR